MILFKVIVKFWGISRFYVISTLMGKIKDIPMPLFSALYMKYLIDKLEHKENFFHVFNLLIIFCSVQLLTSFLNNLLEIKYKGPVREKISQTLMTEFLKKSIKVPLKCFESKEFCDKNALAANELIATYFGLFNGCFDIFTYIFSMVSLVTFIATIEKPLIFLSFIILFIYFIINIKSNRLKIEQEKELIPVERKKKYFSSILTTYNSLKDLKTHLAENFFISKWQTNCVYQLETIKKFASKHLFIANLNSGVFLLCQYVFTFYLAKLVFLGNISIGSFSALFQSLVSFISQLRRCSDVFININQYTCYYKIIEELEQYVPAEKLKTEPIILDKNNKHSIEFNNLTFYYPCTPNAILKNISFKINENEKVAILGDNGSGKSTLVNLLLRLYEPPPHSIFIDGIDILNYDVASLRENFSVIIQNQYNYAMTVIENITLKKEQKLSDLSKIKAILKSTKLYNKIISHKNGLFSEVTKSFSDDGLQFSGGENQKLNLSRFFFKESPILILDEYEKWLDNDSCNAISDAIMRFSENKTLIIISHNKKLMSSMDKVIVLKNGSLKSVTVNSKKKI